MLPDASFAVPTDTADTPLAALPMPRLTAYPPVVLFPCPIATP